MSNGICIYPGAFGRGDGRAAGPFEGKIVDSNLAAGLQGADMGLLGMVAAGAGGLAMRTKTYKWGMEKVSKVHNKIGEKFSKLGKAAGDAKQAIKDGVKNTARRAWSNVRGVDYVDDAAKAAVNSTDDVARGVGQVATRASSILGPDGKPLRVAVDIADDAAKNAAKVAGSVADDAAKVAGSVADDAAKGAAKVAGDAAVAGSKAGALRAAGTFAARGAVVVGVGVDLGMRGYEAYKVEQRHDKIEAAYAQGKVSQEVMDSVSAERNAGHARNAAQFGGGLAGAWAGAKVGVLAGGFVGGPIGGVLGLIVGAGVGYWGGSTLGGKAVDAATGQDASYANTQRALMNLEGGRLASQPAADGHDASKSWAQARAASDYKPVAAVPGLSRDPSVQRLYANAMGSAPSTGVVEGSPADIAPLPRGGVLPSKTKGRSKGGHAFA